MKYSGYLYFENILALMTSECSYFENMVGLKCSECLVDMGFGYMETFFGEPRCHFTHIFLFSVILHLFLDAFFYFNASYSSFLIDKYLFQPSYV